MKYGLFLLFFLFSGTAVAAPRNFDDFATSPEWLAVGHYRPKLTGIVSSIDSKDFFLAPKGKVNPQAELEATITLFQSNNNEKKCKFPARYKLLKKHGLIDVPFPHCGELEQFYSDLKAFGVTLLFTDAYMNNPSSLFGHTLLRVDTARKGTQLLAHGANYGAFTGDNENSVLFAIYGLTGGYYGGFTVKPYYDVINTYNNIENRDIWEFNLDFDQHELDIFVAHLWETGHAQSRYYFFTRNCSYMLMEMLDAVRPSLKLADQFVLQTIPLDTIKAVNRIPGLVKNVNYRPSRQAKIRQRYDLMTTQQRKSYLNVIEGKIDNLGTLSSAQQADVWETAYQFAQYQYVAKNLELKEYRKQSFKALTARNKIKETGNSERLPEGKSPLQSHESMLAVLGMGIRNGNNFEELAYRPAYHSLTDDNYGFLRGAEINFLNAVLRHYNNGDKYVLQKFDLVGIKSLSPVDRMFHPLSYQISASLGREMDPTNEKEGYAFNLRGGAGKTLAVTDEVWIYGMGNSYFSYGGFLPHNQWGGIGFEGGVFADFEKWRFLGSIEKIWASSRFADRIKYKAEAVYSLSTNWAAAAHYVFEDNRGHNIEESMLSVRHYF